MNADLQNSQIDSKPSTLDFNMKGQYQGNRVSAIKNLSLTCFILIFFIFQVLHFCHEIFLQ